MYVCRCTHKDLILAHQLAMNCMSVCMYVCMCVFMYECMNVGMYVCRYACMCRYVKVRYVCVYVSACKVVDLCMDTVAISIM